MTGFHRSGISEGMTEEKPECWTIHSLGALEGTEAAIPIKPISCDFLRRHHPNG